MLEYLKVINQSNKIWVQKILSFFVKKIHDNYIYISTQILDSQVYRLEEVWKDTAELGGPEHDLEGWTKASGGHGSLVPWNIHTMVKGIPEEGPI